MFAILFRILWQYYPSLWACALFWGMVAFSEYQLIQLKRKRKAKINWWTRGIILTGASMNAIVTLANNGRMPVLGQHSFASIWVQGDGKHLLFLCDRFHGFSLGDFFILGGISLSILSWLFRKLFGNLEVKVRVGFTTQSNDRPR